MPGIVDAMQQQGSDMHSFSQRVFAEFVATAGLLAAVAGSGIMADTLSGPAHGVALFGNVLPTVAMLYVLILAFGPISGAHFNPVVTAVFWWRGETGRKEALAFIAAQILGAVLGVVLAHAMFGLDLVQVAVHPRTGYGQWFAEWMATFGLMVTILMIRETRPDAVAGAVAIYILAACWFTASTSFANPAVTIARMFSDTYVGIRPADVVPFMVAQFLGGFSAHVFAGFFRRVP